MRASSNRWALSVAAMLLKSAISGALRLQAFGVTEPTTGSDTTQLKTTATRKGVVSVPIPAVAVRELVYDANGQIVKEPKTDKRRRTATPPIADAAPATNRPSANAPT